MAHWHLIIFRTYKDTGEVQHDVKTEILTLLLLHYCFYFLVMWICWFFIFSQRVQSKTEMRKGSNCLMLMTRSSFDQKHSYICHVKCMYQPVMLQISCMYSRWLRINQRLNTVSWCPARHVIQKSNTEGKVSTPAWVTWLIQAVII